MSLKSPVPLIHANRTLNIAYMSSTGPQVPIGILKNKNGEKTRHISLQKGGKGRFSAARDYQRKTFNINLTHLFSQQQEVKER